jgi:hypothetical protein
LDTLGFLLLRDLRIPHCLVAAAHVVVEIGREPRIGRINGDLHFAWIAPLFIRVLPVGEVLANGLVLGHPPDRAVALFGHGQQMIGRRLARGGQQHAIGGIAGDHQRGRQDAAGKRDKNDQRHETAEHRLLPNRA